MRWLALGFFLIGFTYLVWGLIAIHLLDTGYLGFEEEDFEAIMRYVIGAEWIAFSVFTYIRWKKLDLGEAIHLIDQIKDGERLKPKK